MDEDFINAEWFVKRSFGIRWITAKGVIRNHGCVLNNLSKELAFHICKLHNDELKKGMNNG